MDNYFPKTVKMLNIRRFVFNPRFLPWVIIVINLVFILSQSTNAQEEYPEWIAYDIGNVWSVSSLASEKDTLWICDLDSGLIKLNKITREYSTYHLKDYGFKENGILSILVDKKGNKWLGTSDGLIKFNGTDFILVDSLAKFSYSIFTSFMKFDNHGNLWVNREHTGGGEAKDFAVFDGINWTIYDHSDTSSPYYRANQFAFDSLGNLWVHIFSKGLKEFDGQNWKLHKAGDLFSYISDIEIGKDNKVKWVTTFEPMSGWCQLVKFIDDSNWVLYNAWDSKPNIEAYGFRVMLESDTSIWIAGDYFLTWFDGKDTWRYYTFARGNKDNGISDIVVDEYGNKWLGVNNWPWNHSTPPDYIVVLRDGGVKLSASQDRPIAHIPLSPNPARDYIIATQYIGWDYQIYDLLGNCVQSGLIYTDRINISSLPAGFYTMRFFKDGKQIFEKMMKEM